METFIVEWLSLLGRWVHMITGIAWIGASFYFVWLDNHLQAPAKQSDIDKGVGGEIWSVHGGGFYHAQKYTVSPQELPDTLHWFKWEAYTTWITGMFMLALIYWYGAELYLIDPQVAELSKPVAIIMGMATLVVGWVVYDQLCRSPIGQNESIMGLAMFVLLAFAAWGLCQLFSGRGAFIHFGAMLGTIMVANVAMVIIPGQRDLVTAKQEGRVPDPIHGIRGKQRSVHNTYFTLPVLFVMISNHYAMTYGHQYNWLILVGLSLAGALIRVYFVKRHFGKASLLPLLIAAFLIAAVAAMTVPTQNVARTPSTSTSTESVPIVASFAQVQTIIEQRCVNCHAESPEHPGFAAAPLGVKLETSADIVNQAQRIYQQSVATKAMPLGNLTKMLDEERALIGQWISDGAKAN
ncbi:MAG: urate hydroxylase PuuD [Granulosicoccaceae bacterium]